MEHHEWIVHLHNIRWGAGAIGFAVLTVLAARSAKTFWLTFALALMTALTTCEIILLLRIHTHFSEFL
jgi:hypothetical protein